MVSPEYLRDGYAVFAVEDGVLRWAQAAYAAAIEVCRSGGDLRHGKTWRVGVDELPNAPDGSLDGVPLAGSWRAHVPLPSFWHRAQLSVIYPGYPRQDSDESDAAHRFRVLRDAAHVDGLLPEGADRRRHLREPHSFILGLSLNTVRASPLVVWPGSHLIMRDAFRSVFAKIEARYWGDVDITETYQAARRKVFDTCPRVEVPAAPGQAVLVHRQTLHGVAPWRDAAGPAEGRMIAYFRPQLADWSDWLD